MNGKTRIAFLDGFRIMFFTRGYNGAVTEPFLFDTLLPQDHPRNFRRVHLPLTRDRVPITTALRNAPWEVLNRHEPLAIDPTQAIHVEDFLLRGDSPRNVILAFRTQALIEKAYSPSTDTDIPWDEWGMGSVVLEFPSFDVPDVPCTLVQGLHVIAVQQCDVPGSDRGQLRLRIFDFSLRACEALSDVWEGGGSVRPVRYEDGRDLLLEGSENLETYGLDSLDNGVFFHLVSDLCNWRTRIG